jgi:hypothetical protein
VWLCVGGCVVGGGDGGGGHAEHAGFQDSSESPERPWGAGFWLLPCRRLPARVPTPHSHSNKPSTPFPPPRPHTRYELHTEWEEALDHAQDRGKNTKVVLRVSDVGVTYE